MGLSLPSRRRLSLALPFRLYARGPLKLAGNPTEHKTLLASFELAARLMERVLSPGRHSGPIVAALAGYDLRESRPRSVRHIGRRDGQQC